MATLGFVVSHLGSIRIDALRAQKTARALAEAKTALLWYAQTFRDRQNRIQIDAGNPPPNFMYGYLPLPDLGTGNNTNIGCPWEGCDANLSGHVLDKTVIGRLPWFILGTGPLRDGHGECLWYAVSGSHQRVEKTVPMSWDTLGQIDVVTTNEVDPEKLKILLASPHERPTAIIFSPGPPIGNQSRGEIGGNDVRICGGNYDPKNYLDPTLAAALLDNANNPTSASAYYAGNVSTDTSTTRLAIATQGKINRDGMALKPSCPDNSTACSLVGNDTGLPLPPDAMFDAIRKNAWFRQDINSLLDRMTRCLRDQFFGAGSLPAYGKIDSPAYAGYSSCYNDTVAPQNYFSHYREMIFVAPGSSVTANGLTTCNGALLFSSQRGPGQARETLTDKGNPANYLEDINLASFNASGTAFSGPDLFERSSPMQPEERDIVRCIPNTPTFVTVGPVIAGLGQLATYSTSTRTLTLGQAVNTTQPTSIAGSLFGCAWTPETHPMGGGLRSYFKFRINDAGFSSAPAEGIGFAIVDGDNNGTDACGAAGQHLGYSGNNLLTPFIVPPKIGFEIDPRRESNFNPNASDTLLNGRNDPSLTGGHVALVYWGGDLPIPVGSASCPPPRIDIGGACYLPQQEDDNVHGQASNPRAGFPSPPANPPASAAYKLDPNLSQVPVNRDFHVRVELTRTPTSHTLPTVRVATTGNLDLFYKPGSAIDGVILFKGDRVLVKDQVDPTQNGIYVWNGENVAMNRDADANSVEAQAGLTIEVQQGKTQAKQLWRQQTTQPGACSQPIGCTPFQWLPARVAQFGDLPSAASQPGRVVYVRNGDQGNGWFRSDGASWQRASVTLSAQETINLSSAPANIDGIATVPGSRILVRHQFNAAENGVYVWNGAGNPMSRATDYDAAPELAGALVQVISGSDAGRAFRQTTMAYGGTVGTDAIRWEAIDPSPRYTLQVWILPDSATTANQIVAMQDTTRPMGLLYPGFAPQLSDTPVIPYPFRNVRLGFTVGQRRTVTDQNFIVSNFFTTWIP